nr:MAG TPA: hypothetical protein [Crassvirales sp.]
METLKLVVIVALWVLFLLSFVLFLKEKYEDKKIKWIAEGRKIGLERAKWNVERIFPKLAPLSWSNPREDYYKSIFLDAYTAEIVIVPEDGRYIVLIKKYDSLILKDTNYFFTLDTAKTFVETYRINLLNSISSETI